MVLATLTSFCVRCPTRERSGFYARIREVGGKQQLDPTLLPLKSVKVCGAAVLHHQHKVLRHRQQ